MFYFFIFNVHVLILLRTILFSDYFNKMFDRCMILCGSVDLIVNIHVQSSYTFAI